MTFEQVEQLLIQTAQIANQNAVAIAQVVDRQNQFQSQLEELHDSVEELRGSVNGLRLSVSELREGQAVLTQMFEEDRVALREYRQSTNATLDRIDLVLQEMRRDRDQ